MIYFNFDLLIKILVFVLIFLIILFLVLIYLRKHYSYLKEKTFEYNYKINNSILKLAIVISFILLIINIIFTFGFFLKLQQYNISEGIKLYSLIGLSPLLPAGFLISYIRKKIILNHNYLMHNEES